VARIDDLISQVGDKVLQADLSEAVIELRRSQRFGLVFEQHIPETTTIASLPVQVGSVVQVRTDSRHTDATYEVTSIAGVSATLTPRRDAPEREATPVKDLSVVKRFGEPVFPSLTRLGGVTRANDTRPEHTVINAENYHALQLLSYLYEKQVDCIYIDPPYNTGARDWKYNNRYVDENDMWRHSKWLSMIERRLLVAKRLLKPDSVLIVTIDEHEVHHLRMLLERVFPDAFIQMVTIVVNPKGVAQGRFARVEEYAIYCFFGTASVSATSDDYMSDNSTQKNTRFWKGLLRAGTNALPSDGLNMVYPIAVDPARARVVGTGRTLKERIDAGEVDRATCDAWLPDPDETVDGYPVVWPLRRDGSLGVWQAKPDTLHNLNDQGYLKVVFKDSAWAVSYVASGTQQKVTSGEITLLRRDGDDGPVILERTTDKTRAKTVWKRAEHDSGWHGSVLLRELLGARLFDFPKSLYAVRDSLLPIVGDRPDALIVDFFAGSGTTFHATALINQIDGGSRRTVMVTNNEVSEADSKRLTKDGEYPGTTEWEAAGIFSAVTRPRCEAAVTGHRPDGQPIEGEYSDETARAEGFIENVGFYRLDYLDPDGVDLGRQFDAVHPLLWMSAGATGPYPTPIERDCFWVMPDGCKYGILLKEGRFRQFKAALAKHRNVTHVWFVTDSEDAYQEMVAALPRVLVTSMMYRDYLRNFRINTERTAP
jgi:adenine-specific DNA-methyltransferase